MAGSSRWLFKKHFKRNLVFQQFDIPRLSLSLSCVLLADATCVKKESGGRGHPPPPLIQDTRVSAAHCSQLPSVVQWYKWSNIRECSLLLHLWSPVQPHIAWRAPHEVKSTQRKLFSWIVYFPYFAIKLCHLIPFAFYDNIEHVNTAKDKIFFSQHQSLQHDICNPFPLPCTKYVLHFVFFPFLIIITRRQHGNFLYSLKPTKLPIQAFIKDQ